MPQEKSKMDRRGWQVLRRKRSHREKTEMMGMTGNSVLGGMELCFLGNGG